jgi:RNA polymerase sigma factor (sigma-70 family)
MRDIRDIQYPFLRKHHIKISLDKIEELFKDREANKDTIVRTQFALVIMMVEKFSLTSNQTISDLTSNALEGLYKAVENYDTDKANNGFSQFASYAIRNSLLSLISYQKTHECNIISKPLKASDNPCYVFSDMNTTDDDNHFENTLVADDETEHRDIEDELIQLIKDSLKKEMWSDIVIKRMGLGLLKPVQYKVLSEKYGKSKQSINALYNTGINKLKKNVVFINKLKELTDS